LCDFAIPIINILPGFQLIPITLALKHHLNPG
jgi:hypothetical protein